MAGEEFKVRVGVELDDASFNALKSQINGKTPIPVKVKLDTSDVDNDIKTLKNQIESLGKTNITLSGATKIESALNNIANSVKEMKTSLSSLNNVKIKPQMDVSDVKKAATEVKRQTESIATAATKTKRIISGVSTEAIKITGRNLTGINKKLGIDGLALNKRQISDITGHLKDMKVALDDITVGSGKNTIEITTHGFDEAGRKITKIMKAKAILDDDGRFVKWDWNVDTTKATKQIDTLGEAIKKSKSIIKDFNGNTIQTNVKVIEDSFKKLGESSSQSLKEMQTAFNNFTTEYSQWQASSTKNNPTEVKAMVNAYNELAIAMTKAKNEEKLLRSNASLSKMTDDVSKEVADIDLTFKKAGANVSSLDTKFSKISGQSKEAEVAVEKLKSAYDELGASIKKNTTQVVEGDDTTREVHNLNEIVLALENYKKAYEEATAAVKKNKAESDKVLSAEKYKNDKTNFINQIERYKSDNSAALLKYGKQLDELIAKTKQLNGVSLNGVKQEFKELQNTIEKDGLATQSFGDKLKTQFKRYAAYFSIASVTMEATQALRQMYQSVLEIDTAMTELYRVTDLTSQGYANLYDNMIASAKQYGATLSDIINSTADWSRAGFDPETANSLAGITMMYEHIADIDYDEATQNLLTAYKGFQGQLDSMFNNDAEASVTYIADILNELDNNYAVTAAGVGEAMRRSAASMDVANNSIEQTAALITGAIEVTQDPEGAGNALKVVSMRLRGAKGELEDLGEEVDSNVENLTQMQGKILNLTHGKVNIFEDNGDFKSTYDILVGIADVYDQLSDMEQADLLETIAGKHRANTVASIIGNIDQVKAAYQSATEASGSASEENEKYMNSLEGHLNKLTTAWQSFSNSFLSSGFLKGLISTASGFLNVIDSIVDKMGTIPTIISLIAAGLSGIKNIGFFKTVKDEATGFVTKMELSFAGLKGKIGEFKDLLNNSVKFDFDKDFTDSLGLNEKTLNQYIDSGQKSEYLEDATDAVTDYVKATDKASISVEDFRGKQMAAAAQINGSARTFKGASNVISVFNSMTKETEKTQQGFVSAIANSNPKLASYLSSVKAGSASFKGYIGSLVGATAKTVALTAVTTALNAALTMGISVLVSAAISAIDSWIHKNEKLAESVQDVIDKYNEQKNSLKDAKAVVDEVVTSDGSKSRYEELSKGVDSLGKNVSLTADEYSEYLDITSRIASTFPELIQGYDSQGNAILSCKGNVEELTEAYNKLGHAANKEILNKDSIDDIQEDFKNDIEDLNNSGWLNDKLTTDAAKALEKMINSDDVSASVEKNAKGYYTQIAKALHDAKIGDYESIDPYRSTTSQLNEYITKCIETDRDAVQKIVNAHNNELDDAASEMKTIAEATLSEAFDFSDSDYHGMSDSLKTIAQQAVSGLDGEFYKKVVDGGGNVEDYIQSMVDALDELDNSGNSTVETAFDLQTKFNNGEVSYGEYADALAKAQNTIDHLEGVDGEIKAQLKLALDTKDAENQYETFVNRLTEAGWSEDAAKKFARSLSSSEMEVAFDLIAKGELKVKNADELREQLEEQAKLNEAMSFSIDMEAETEGVEALTTALTESNSATGLTVESMEKLKARYKDLDGYNPATLFQETANGLMLNASAARELEKAYAESKLSEANDNLTTLKQRYDELGVEIRECDDASKKASLINEREDIRQQITQIAEYATALEGLTSAYADWQTAESAGSNRDMYSNVQSAMESVKEELDLGWIDDGTKEYFDLIWGDNWNGAGKGISDYRAQWDTLDDTIEGTTYSLQDFFKTDEDGNLTSKGIYNFLDAVKQKQKELGKDWVQTDKNGNIVSFDFGVDGTKAVADALGISEDLVNIFLKASQDCGFVVNFDGTYKQLADLQNEAMAANDKLKELGKTDYTFNFDSKNIKDLNNQLEVAKDILADKSFWNKDGTFNFNAKGATEAMQVVSTLRATIDSLDNKYIGLTVDDSSLKEPLEKLQEYESTTAEINQLELDPKANTEEIEAAKEKLHNIVDYFYKLDNTEKKKLGIDVDASWEEIQEMVEKGEIEIPAALDIQTSINDNLEDLVKLSLLNSGVLSPDEEMKIKQELKVEYGISDDSDTPQDVKQEIREKFADYSGTEDLDVDVNVNVEGEQDVGSLIDYLGGLSDEQIQVIANVIGKVDVEQLQGAINDIDDDKYIKLIAEALGSGDVNALADAINKIPNESVKKAIAKAFGYNSVEELDNAIRGMDNKTVKAIAQALGISDVNSLKSVVNSLDDKTVQAIAEAIGQGKVQSLIDTIAGLHNKKVTVTTVMTTVKNVVTNAIKNGAAAGKAARNNRFGSSNIDGTAFAGGTVGSASKHGDWGTKASGKALVGELGQELLVRDGQYYTIGDNGAEFINYKKGDIIFNAGQTRQLFEQGKIANGQTRGRAYANGTAFAPGTAGGTMSNLINAAILYCKDRVIDDDQLSVDVGVNLDTSSIEAQLIEYEKGGNVNLLVRPQIDAQYLKDVGWDDAGDGVATVFTSTYTNEDGTVAVNFTPIIADKDGKFVGVLGPDELQEYAEGVIAGTRADDLNLQIGAEFTGEDAIEKADRAAQRIHELHEIYFADDPVIQYASEDSKKSVNTSTTSTNSTANNSASGTASGTVWNPEFNSSEALDTLDKLNDALAESESETGLTAEGFDNINKAFKDLKSFNPSKMFIKTANGVKVSRQEFAKCKQELVATNKAAAANDMSNLVNQYNELTAAIGNATEASSRADNIKKRNAVKEQMLALAQQGIAYSTNNDKYNEWLNSQSMPEGKDAYGAIAQYKSQVQEDIDNGWFTNADKAYVGLLTGLDAATASVDEAWAAWKSTFDKKIAGGKYSIQDVFTVDDEGNVTSDGVDRFMEGIQTDFKDDIYKFNEDTGEWYYDFSEENVQKIQDVYGMGIDSIGIMLEAAAQAGYDVDWGDMFDLSKYDVDTTPIDQLISLAELAETELGKLGKNVDFNFSADNLADADAEIERAHTELSEFLNEDGTINFNVEGADKAAAIMAMLTIQKNQLTAPAFMTVDTSQLTGANTVIGDYVAKAQQFQEAMENYRIAAASGSTEQIEQASQNLTNAATDYQNAASALSESNPEVAVQLGADDAQGLATQVQDALNNGDMTVQAKAEITQGVTDKLAEDIKVPAIAEITHVSESKLVNEDAYNASVSVQVADITSGIPGVVWDGTKLTFSNGDVTLTTTNDGTNGTAQVDNGTVTATTFNDGTNGTAEVDESTVVGTVFEDGTDGTAKVDDGTARATEVEDGANGDWSVDDGTARPTEVEDGANGDWTVSGGTAEVKEIDASGANVHADTLTVGSIEAGEINGQSQSDATDNSPSDEGKTIPQMTSDAFHWVDQFLRDPVSKSGDIKNATGQFTEGVRIGFANLGSGVAKIFTSKNDGTVHALAPLENFLTDIENKLFRKNSDNTSNSDVDAVSGASSTQDPWSAKPIVDKATSEVTKVPDELSKVPSKVTEELSNAPDKINDGLSQIGPELASVPEKFGKAISDAWNNSDIGKFFNDAFGIKQANAAEADEGSSAKDSSNNSGESGSRSANSSKPVQHNNLTEAGSVVSVDTSNAPEAEVPVKGELEDTDTSNAPEEQIGVKGKIDEVDDSVLNDQFQIAVDDSGIKDALQDGETLRSMLLGLDDDTLMTFGNIAPGFQNALGSAQELRDVITNVPADGLQASFSSVYDGLGDALTSAEALNEYLNSITDEGQRQVVIDLIMSKESKEQELTADVTGNTTKLDEAVEKPRETTSIIVPDVARVLSRMAQGFNAVARITPQLTTSTLTVAVNTLVNSFTKTGSSKADGTAYVNGTVGKAFKHGNWGTGDSGTALVGELGQEMVVRDGQFFTIGDNGAEFFQYKKNDIIFNAGQTKQLFEQGKITNGRTRGRAFSGGWNATASKNNFGNEKKNYRSNSSSGSGSGSSSGSNSSNSDASDEADEFEETLDWIETKIDRIERAISKLDTTASSVYKNWGTRNEALVNQISKVGEEINLQQQAYDRYMKQANSVGLSEDYASKVRDGTIDIETITDEDLNDKISEYKEW